MAAGNIHPSGAANWVEGDDLQYCGISPPHSKTARLYVLGNFDV
jgi:hypothetical protein